MFLAILTLITALAISAVAIYYSVAGLVAIFAAAAVPIMIMGGTLEIAKLVTAVWLHKHWQQATWWLKTYLSTAVIVLMFITSMGIFGFLSKAHIEQTSASEESVARSLTIQTEIDRQLGIVGRAENKIRALENSETGADANIQAQIDKEQERIDKAFDRIQPAIIQQNKIIEDARATDGDRTKPYEDQLTSITAEILRLETSAKEYETKIENLESDSSAVEPLLAQIDALEEEIIRVTNQLNSSEQGQIRAGQAIIGVTSDGLFGGNTRTALATWVSGQRDRITQIQGEVAQVRKDATTTVDVERVRLAGVVKDIREVQIPALKDRELTMLGKIDDVRKTESPSIATARDEIQRLRESAESQVAQSNILINRLRDQLGDKTNADQIEKDIDEQNERVRTASSEIDKLTEEKIEIDAEYRKLEAEVGPIKYIAEFVYGEEATNNMLEEAVRWVIIIIIFVFDPLAVLLLIASQYTFHWRNTGGSLPPKHDPDNDPDNTPTVTQEEWDEAHRQNYEFDRAKAIDANIPPDTEEKKESVISKKKTDQYLLWEDIDPEPQETVEQEEINPQKTVDPNQIEIDFDTEPKKKYTKTINPFFYADEKVNDVDDTIDDMKDKGQWPDQASKESQQTVTQQLEKIDDLDAWNSWVEKANEEAENNPEDFKQNSEQNENSVFNKINKARQNFDPSKIKELEITEEQYRDASQKHIISLIERLKDGLIKVDDLTETEANKITTLLDKN